MSESPWHPICALASVPDDAPMAARVAGQRLVVARCGDGVSVFDDACPHEGYPLSKGTLVDGELVCPWHNFRFAADTGTCRKGDEDAIPKPVRVVDGTIWVDLTPPPLDQQRARLEDSLKAGVLEMRTGQIARDVVRLLHLGVSVDDVLTIALHLDAQYREWGTSHVLPYVADVRARAQAVAVAERPVDAARLVFPVFQLVSEQIVRRPTRPTPAPEAPTDLPTVAAELRARVLAEDAEGAEALARGAALAGWGFADAQEALLLCCADHLLSFAHPQIYATKLALLPPMAPDVWADVVGALVFNAANGTREDSVPEWRPVLRRLDQAAPLLDAVATRWSAESANPAAEVDCTAWLDTVVNSRWKDALTVTFEALDAGASPSDLAKVLVLAGAERVLRFDRTHDADPTLQEGWLDATHRLTGAQAVGESMGRIPWSDWLQLALKTLVWVVRGAPLDGPTDPIVVPEASSDPLAALEAAIRTGERGQAMGVAGQLGPTPAVQDALVELSLALGAVRGIVEVHLVKTVQAGIEAARTHADPRPLQAAVRVLASPVQEDFAAARLHEALRFVVDGKVPRTLT